MDISGGTRAALGFALLVATSMVAAPALAGGEAATADRPATAATDAGTASSALGGGAGVQTTDENDSTAVEDAEATAAAEANSSVDGVRKARDLVASLDLEDDEARTAANETVAALEAALESYPRPNAPGDAAAFEHLRDAQSGLRALAASTDEHDHAIARASELVHRASGGSARLATLDAGQTVGTFEDDLASAGRLDDASEARDESVENREAAQDAALPAGTFAASVDAPPVVEANDTVTLPVTVTNVGAAAETATIDVTIGNETRDERDVTLAPDESWTHAYEIDANESGRVEYAVATPDHEYASAVDVVEERFEVEGYQPQPIDGTEQYYDLTGTGDVTAQDLTFFFATQHRSPIDDRPDLFDFTGDGTVGQPDVVRLFEVVTGDVDLGGPAEPPASYDLDDLLASRVDAIEHHRDAWSSAEAARAVAEDAATPTLTLERGEAYERNGTVLVPIRATVSDVRPERYGNATVTLANGTTLDPIRLHPESALSSDAGGATVLDLGPTAENRTIDVVAAADDDPERSASATLEIVVEDEDVVPEQPAPDEYNEAEVEDEETGVQVEAGGEGLWEPDLSVENATRSDEASDYTAGPVVRIENQTAVGEATVTLPYDDESLSAENLSVVTWKPDDERGWRLLPTDVDATNGTVSADVDHFSYFAAIDASAWEEHRTETITLEPRHFANETEANVGTDPDPALIGHWSLDDTDTGLRDQSGLGNHGDLVGGADVDSVDGVFGGSGLDFESLEAHVQVPSTNTLRGGTDARLSGSVWFKPTIENRGANNGLLGKQDSFTHGDWGLVFHNSCPTEGQVITTCEGEPPYVGYYSEVEGNDYRLYYGPIDRHEWHHAAFTLDQPNGTVSLYYNGELVLQDTDAPHVSANTDTPVELGASSYRDAYFEGALDEARVYDRVLDDEEVRQLYEVNGVHAVGLRDSSGDGIPDAVADANPSLPVPTDTPDSGTGALSLEPEPIDVDPYVEDTSGDGLADAEQIDVQYRVFEEDNETKLETWVESALAHPNRTDTTGDGLTDREQLEGWEIQVVDDHDDARELEEAVENGETGDDLLPFFTAREVQSNPLLSDTDGDGLSDVEERNLGTDPDADDTTGDGITDFQALHKYEQYEDPTIFTTSGPRIGLTHYDSGWSSDEFEFTRYTFTYQYQLEDGAGVKSAQVVQNEKEGPYNTYDGQRLVHEHDEITSEADGLFQYSRGLDAEITAWDVYDNERSEVFVVQRSLGPILLDEYEWMEDNVAGVVSGWTHGAAELPDLALLFFRSPRETADALGGLSKEFSKTKIDPDPRSDVEFWIALGDSMAEATHVQQNLDNPNDPPVDEPEGYWDACLQEYRNYDEPPTEYCEYATGWYQGYALFALIDVVIGSRGSVKTADGIEDVADAAQTASRQADEVNWAAALDEPGTKTTRVNQRLLADGGPYADDLPLRLDTAGKQATTVQRMSEVDSSVLQALDASQQGTLARHLQNNPHGVDVVNELGPVGTEQLVRSGELGTVMRATKSIKGAPRQGFVGTLRSLDDAHRAELLEHLDSHPGGSRVVADLGPQRTEQLFSLSFQSVDQVQFRANLLRNGDEIPAQRLNQYVDDVAIAQNHPNIDNFEGLVKETIENGNDFTQIRGQAGEARSAIRHAEDGKQVTVEPGQTDAYDLSVQNNGATTYADIKTRAPARPVDERWVESQITSMNGKYEDALNDPDLAPEASERVLEIRTSSSPSNLQAATDVARETAESLEATPNARVEVDKIRVIAMDGTAETITLTE